LHIKNNDYIAETELLHVFLNTTEDIREQLISTIYMF